MTKSVLISLDFSTSTPIALFPTSRKSALDLRTFFKTKLTQFE